MRQALLNAEVIAEQAICKPRVQLLDLDNSDYTPIGAVYFPSCIQVRRCGGCCGLSGLMECKPTNVTYREVYRAKIKPSMHDQQSNGQLQVLSIEEHHACHCQCRVQSSDCMPLIHEYRKDLCRCECINSREREAACLSYPWKRWNAADCTCNCLATRRCSSGFVFSHETCRCEFFERLPLN